MKTEVLIERAKVFKVKPLGQNGCRFGIKISSKKQDGTWTKGTFINCKHNSMLQDGDIYDLRGFLGDNEYNDKNTLEFIVMSVGDGRATPPKPAQAKKQEPDRDSEIPY